MIRQTLELIVGEISDSLFKDIMEATKEDIIVNQVEFKQMTSFNTMIDRAVIAFNIFCRCEQIKGV